MKNVYDFKIAGVSFMIAYDGDVFRLFRLISASRKQSLKISSIHLSSLEEYIALYFHGSHEQEVRDSFSNYREG